jgi:hypothetical protein
MRLPCAVYMLHFKNEPIQKVVLFIEKDSGYYGEGSEDVFLFLSNGIIKDIQTAGNVFGKVYFELNEIDKFYTEIDDNDPPNITIDMVTIQFNKFEIAVKEGEGYLVQSGWDFTNNTEIKSYTFVPESNSVINNYSVHE